MLINNNNNNEKITLKDCCSNLKMYRAESANLRKNVTESRKLFINQQKMEKGIDRSTG